ncbi:MAG: GNAT family N-acetyltransferase [Anaerolineales bacterium]|jgi:ribosomal protein S18 acetylase RimI-like enzyme
MDLIITREAISVRLAQEKDRRHLANLIHFSNSVHRHLDWRSPLDWIGYQPYIVAEREGCILAALACPPDPPEVAWIRLLAVANEITAEEAWEYLWPAAHEYLWGITIAAIPLQGWFTQLLSAAQFEQTYQVMMLRWENQRRLQKVEPTNCTIRLMNYDDLEMVKELDTIAFGPIWRQSMDMLEIAFHQAAIATIAEDQDGMIGYQISTASSAGGHLARLAVHPRVQVQGVGSALVRDLLLQFARRGAQQVTVNTQMDNSASLALYKKAGFRPTGEVYPVYETCLD